MSTTVFVQPASPVVLLEPVSSAPVLPLEDELLGSPEEDTVPLDDSTAPLEPVVVAAVPSPIAVVVPSGRVPPPEDPLSVSSPPDAAPHPNPTLPSAASSAIRDGENPEMRPFLR